MAPQTLESTANSISVILCSKSVSNTYNHLIHVLKTDLKTNIE
uniref:Uncharacterized protein n=1 Tax=Anguilla anguilla TaxID=7936 RepID=A0A0E9QES9_ANGAN